MFFSCLLDSQIVFKISLKSQIQEPCLSMCSKEKRLEISKLLKYFQIVSSQSDIKLTVLLYSVMPTLLIHPLKIPCVVCKKKFHRTEIKCNPNNLF